jgi:predicted transporter
MFARLIDDFKDRTGAALRQTSLVAMAAFTLFIAIAFLCAAGFVWMLRTYGPIEACLAGACVFLVIALIMMGIYILRKRQIEARAAARAKSAMQIALADPMVVTAGIQLIRAIGVKKLIPILALGGLALGLMASRNTDSAADQAPAE